MQPVILDTDVASPSHKGRLPDPLSTRLTGRRPLITFITLGELTKWAEIRHWGTRSRQALADWISGMVVLPGNDAVAVSWGRHRPTKYTANEGGSCRTCGALNPAKSVYLADGRRVDPGPGLAAGWEWRMLGTRFGFT
jgi:hypothetical protein